jgi:hypothetical protein
MEQRLYPSLFGVTIHAHHPLSIPEHLGHTLYLAGACHDMKEMMLETSDG